MCCYDILNIIPYLKNTERTHTLTRAHHYLIKAPLSRNTHKKKKCLNVVLEIDDAK